MAPGDAGNLVDQKWIMGILPAKTKPKNPAVTNPQLHADYQGRWGKISWMGSEEGNFVLWLNGAILDYSEMTQRRFILICVALDISLIKDVADGIS